MTLVLVAHPTVTLSHRTAWNFLNATVQRTDCILNICKVLSVELRKSVIFSACLYVYCIAMLPHSVVVDNRCIAVLWLTMGMEAS